jgi:hypothetical protein
MLGEYFDVDSQPRNNASTDSRAISECRGDSEAEALTNEVTGLSVL